MEESPGTDNEGRGGRGLVLSNLTNVSTLRAQQGTRLNGHQAQNEGNVSQ